MNGPKATIALSPFNSQLRTLVAAARQCSAQQFVPTLCLQYNFRVVRRIRDGRLNFFVQFSLCPVATCRKRLMPGNRH